MEQMTRSEIAELTGIGRETLRYYEKRGIIPDPPRSSAGYRLYDKCYARRIRFIGRAQELGFTLKEIKELLELRVDPDTTCKAVKTRAENKIEDVATKIRDLQSIRQALIHLADSCSGQGPTSDCPILEAMEDREVLDDAL